MQLFSFKNQQTAHQYALNLNACKTEENRKLLPRLIRHFIVTWFPEIESAYIYP